MRKLVLLSSVMLVTWGCSSPEPEPEPLPPLTPAQRADFENYAANIEKALGIFEDIHVLEPNGEGGYHLLQGEYVPVTVNGEVPTRYFKDQKSDRPMMLPTQVVEENPSDGQSNPFTIVGRMPGSNPEVQWVFLVRQYDINDTTSADFDHSPDMAVIGHHPRTGASAYLQFYDPKRPKNSQIVRAPWSPEGPDFWAPMDTLVSSFRCQRCHSAGPFIHTPWINQVTIGGGPGEPPAEPMVPSDPLGPFFFVDSQDGGRFWTWDSAMVADKGGGHLANPANKCTQCHRVSPDMIGLNQNSTRYYGMDSLAHNSWSIRSDSFQTAEYDSMMWMPPADPAMIDLYAGQKAIPPTAWEQTYGASAAEVNLLFADSARWADAHQLGMVEDIPRPPGADREIVVKARPETDRVAPGQSLWVVDSRMRANTNGELAEWKYFTGESAGPNVTAAPVVFRRIVNDGSSIDFEVVFVGDAQSASTGADSVAIRAGETFDLQWGDYLGVVFTNTGNQPADAIIPYSDDRSWAHLQHPDGSTWLRDGNVTYWLNTSGAPTTGQVLSFQNAGFRTYSLEFKNRL